MGVGYHKVDPKTGKKTIVGTEGYEAGSYLSELSEEQLRQGYAAASYTGGRNLPIFPVRASNWALELKQRGIDPTEIKPVESLTDVQASLPMFHHGQEQQSEVRQQLAERLEFEQVLKEQERRTEAIETARGALEDFSTDRDYDSLLERLRNLPPTYTDEDIRRLRATTVNRIRIQEAERLRKVGAVMGMSGRGGPVFAYMAAREAEKADREITNAFSQIYFEQMSKKREDELTGIGAESALLGERRANELQLQANLQSAIAGLPVTPLGQPLHTMSGYLESVLSREQAKELAKEANKAAVTGAGIGAAGEVVSSLVPLLGSL